jgi:hypothetical protein
MSKVNIFCFSGSTKKCINDGGRRLGREKVTENKNYKRWKIIVAQFDSKTFFFVF